jgi:hypothetical protein
MPSDPEKEIYVNIAVIRDTLEILVKRGKPASVADLQTLMASVEAKSRPNYILPAKEVADALAPKLLPLLPTPDNLVQAGQQSAVRMEAAIKAGTVDSVKLIQVTMQKFVTTLEDSATKASASAAEYKSATAAAPRSFTVDLAQSWRWVAGLVLVPLMVLLLGQAVTGQFSKVDKEDYEQLQAQHAALQVKEQKGREANAKMLSEDKYYFDQIKKYKAKNRKTTDFPAYKVAK